MKRLRIRAIVFALAAGFFGYVFYTRYWIWRDCIAASQSSCLTPDGSNVTDGGMVWGVIALGFAAAASLNSGGADLRVSHLAQSLWLR